MKSLLINKAFDRLRLKNFKRKLMNEEFDNIINFEKYLNKCETKKVNYIISAYKRQAEEFFQFLILTKQEYLVKLYYVKIIFVLYYKNLYTNILAASKCAIEGSFSHSPVQELERLAFDRSFTATEVNTLRRIATAVGRHKSRTEQRETADDDRERGTESSHSGHGGHATSTR
ncbi:hypothetical protein AGLY_009336 [Aphis glycines]|uniref:Uncharacterized protein n=1 Tax=Aphis glycines TaxID=307491 RepID=A0A6G0TI36_APHGL|nr:hypothetical protein AGLY_009336 [Aphis glycines]